MRTLDKCLYFEGRMPDGTWERIHLEQIEIGDVIRCRLADDKKFTSYKNDQDGTDTECLTLLTQVAYRVMYGDFGEAVIAELKKRSMVLPGDPAVAHTITIDPKISPLVAKPKRTPRKK